MTILTNTYHLFRPKIGFIQFLFFAFSLCFSSCHSSKKISTSQANSSHEPTETVTKKSTKKSVVKHYTPPSHKQLKRKYAALLETKPSKIRNKALYYFIDEWMDVPYRWGGNDKSGVDCSGFVHQLYQKVYGLNIDRTVASLYDKTKNFKKQKKFSEGDLVYFKTEEQPDHVGVFLMNGYFVHSSKGKGVHINNLNERYWKQVFIRGGKVKAKS
ncbi:MAG: C40 family peptidase [Bacteroidetes bacterium]|nr:C40 family peptidase [Bacteroidota bacterium]